MRTGNRGSIGKESQGVLVAFISVCVLMNVFMERCYEIEKPKNVIIIISSSNPYFLVLVLLLLLLLLSLVVLV